MTETIAGLLLLILLALSFGLVWRELSKAIKDKLCPDAWKLTRNGNLVNQDENGLVKTQLTIVNQWTESHFRALFKHCWRCRLALCGESYHTGR